MARPELARTAQWNAWVLANGEAGPQQCLSVETIPTLASLQASRAQIMNCIALLRVLHASKTNTSAKSPIACGHLYRYYKPSEVLNQNPGLLDIFLRLASDFVTLSNGFQPRALSEHTPFPNSNDRTHVSTRSRWQDYYWLLLQGSLVAVLRWQGWASFDTVLHTVCFLLNYCTIFSINMTVTCWMSSTLCSVRCDNPPV